MPMRYPTCSRTDAKNAWATVAEEDTEVLGVTMRLGFFAPPGILERLMASCYGLRQVPQVLEARRADRDRVVIPPHRAACKGHLGRR